MKCGNCKVSIGSEFSYAIKNNLCPACGKNIMDQDKLASYLSLKNLLSKSYGSDDVEKISSLIMANFELKQVFVTSDESKSPTLQKASAVDVVEEEAEPEPEVVYDDDGIKYEKRKTEELKKMREQIYRDSLKESSGIELTDDVILPIEEEIVQKQKRARASVVNGTGIIRR